MDNVTAAASKPEPPVYIEIEHRASLEFALATFGIGFPIWAVVAVVAGLANWRDRREYERRLVEWALALAEGERLVVAMCEVTRPDLVTVDDQMTEAA